MEDVLAVVEVGLGLFAHAPSLVRAIVADIRGHRPIG